MIHTGVSIVDYQYIYEQHPLYQNPYEFTISPQYHFTPSNINYESQLEEESKIKKQAKNNKKNKKKELLFNTQNQIEQPIQQNEMILQQIIPTEYSIQQGTLLPQQQSHLITQQNLSTSKQIVKSNKLTKKLKKENINIGHWSTIEHTNYINFLSQYENIMNSSMMKKTSKIFKLMSELIGTRTPSQCRSHHQKFNPYTSKVNNQKRQPRTQRNQTTKKKQINHQTHQSNQLIDNDFHYFTQDKINQYSPFIFDYQLNQQENQIQPENPNCFIQTPFEYEDDLKLRQDYRNLLEY
ncbi:unnamed protein product [Paramecium sonneborni]|uniref:Myb-like domain-containing protein n=1 Tax=Paramecium sonneborni TaxID=65129 RepID=A0A8S1NXI7_9CILI|nr:unnamed protein product [Paramecium sonneborni]